MNHLTYLQPLPTFCVIIERGLFISLLPFSPKFCARASVVIVFVVGSQWPCLSAFAILIIRLSVFIV